MDVLNKREMNDLLQLINTDKEIIRTALKLFSSATASAAAEAATFPLDLTKTRLQLQGEVAALPRHGTATVVKRGMVLTAVTVAREEGITNLWSGLQPAICRQMIYTGMRLAVYEQMREHVLHYNADGSFPLHKAIIGGMCAGAVGQFVASPMDLAKIRMQTINQKYRTSPQYKRIPIPCRTLLCILRTTYSVSGIRGLWTGWAPSVQRAALVNIGNLATYDIAKQKILKQTAIKDNFVCHILASMCAGFAAAVLSTPADVIKTRIMNQRRDIKGRGMFYTSSLDCLVKTIHKEGVSSLYKGFVPTWSRIAPWSMIFWLTNEEVRKLIGLDSF